MHLVPIDIETIPGQPEDELKAAIAKTIQAPAQMKKPETIEKWHAGEGDYAGVKDALIDEAYHKTCFDGGVGQICSISWAANMDDKPETLIATPGNEAELLRLFFDVIKDIAKHGMIMPVGHNIGGFDLRFIWQRCVINRIKPTGIDFHGRHRQTHFDTMVEWAGFSKANMISQDNLCKALGIDLKGGDDMDGSKVWEAYKAEDYERIRTYNKKDVREIQAMYKAMHFLS